MIASLAMFLATAASLPALAAAPAAPMPAPAAIPPQLDAAQRDGYQAVFAAIREERWQDAQLQLDSIKPGPLHAIARAELYTAKGSPRVELEPLVELLTQSPELPQSDALARLAKARGALELPPLPVTRTLIWRDGAPARLRAKAVKGDGIAADLTLAMQPFVKVDDGAAAESLLDATPGLTPEALTEWRQRVAWMYYLSGRDADARRVALLGADGAGDWAVPARWVAALAMWRLGDATAAATAFEGVATRAGDVDLRATALYWAARADMAAGRPDRIEARLKTAAQWDETFYGQLAKQALGLRSGTKPRPRLVPSDWAALDRRPNIRVAAALAEIGETDLADKVVRQQARIGEPGEFAALARLADALDLPATTFWLAHNRPTGAGAAAEARFPTPSWKPESGWRVDRALVFAHALQESSFRAKVVSPAGAYGLMQIMPAAATDFARERGLPAMDRTALTRPSVNMDVGQRHLERLRDMTGTTGGLLPKVIAAYNAGAKPVAEWNAIVRDGGDPLLYIESIPYWETRGYVTTVLRNYWVYEAQTGKTASASRTALAQGLWPRFPGLPGATSVRLDARPSAAASAALANTTGTD
ncbi:MAG: lytic transglycosylase protein [Sphingomonas bacterium]|uniref:lytic transglycosylase domain-containing protein n=1 Tax=Sphingomonas bacterium TaxID=1895847 RepID=UPI00260B43EF|nr:lytic transglycosylase domain-containing protein [Sphingomonas bacterium]MDB5695589.1 lytic transglycosylase protein [Sphingomonas bacterium]